MSADATTWSSEAWSEAADDVLLAHSRTGSAEAFGELWRRHLPAAYAVAHRYRGRTPAEDVVAEAAVRVWALLREARGPDQAFRAYFLAAVRTVALDAAGRDLRLLPTEEHQLEVLADAAGDLPAAEPFTDDDTVELVRTAFRSLPETDQRVLWHTTVEGAAPRVVAAAYGISANTVSARAVRAREALRARYLDAFAARGLPAADTDECRWTVSRLGALVRGRLPRRQTQRAEAHVASCPHAAQVAADLRVIHEGFPALVVPLVLAAGVATPGFLSAGALGVLGASAAGAAGLTGAAGATEAAGAVTAPPSGASSASATLSSVPAGAVNGAVDVLGQVVARVASVAAATAVAAGGAGLLHATPAPPGEGATAPPRAVAAGPAPGRAASVPVTGGLPVPTPTLLPASLAVSTAPPATAATAAAGPPPGAALLAVPTGSGGVVPTVDATTAPVAGGPAVPSVPGVTDPPSVTGGPTEPAPVVDPPAGPPTGTPEVPAPPAKPPTTRPPRPTPPTQPPTQPPTTRPTTPQPTRTPPTTPPPRPTPTRPPTPVPGPTTEPAPDPVIRVSARAIGRGDPARFQLSVTSTVRGRLTLTVATASGEGALRAANRAWSCRAVTASALTCTGTAAGGRPQFVLSGLGGLAPVSVTVAGGGTSVARTFFG